MHGRRPDRRRGDRGEGRGVVTGGRGGWQRHKLRGPRKDRREREREKALTLARRVVSDREVKRMPPASPGSLLVG